MPTKFGGRERPYLEIVGWVRFGAHGGLEAIESNIQPETQQRCIGSTATRYRDAIGIGAEPL